MLPTTPATTSNKRAATIREVPRYLIRSAIELQLLANLHANRRIERPFEIRLSIPEIADEQSARFEHQINMLLRVCGCGLGGAMSLMGLVLVIVGRLRAGHTLTVEYVAVSVGLAILVSACAGIAGKTIGIALARRQLQKTCTAIIRYAQQSSVGTPFGMVNNV